MRLALIPLFLLLLLVPHPSLAIDNTNAFITLSFHDVTDKRKDILAKEAVTISTAELISLFSWFREHGFHPVSIDEIIAARDGKKVLPEKAVLLTFDDGYRSMYTRVFPLLKLFNYPAISALVGEWLVTDEEEKVSYGSSLLDRKDFLFWEEIKEMQASGLVEFASHSYDLHHGIVANLQGNLFPSAVTRLYNQSDESFESDDEYIKRLQNDLKKSVQLMEDKTGLKPRVMIWPYGRYNKESVEVAKSLGLTITMGLEEGWNDINNLETIKRFLLPDDMTLNDFVWTLYNYHIKEPVRVAQVDLDYVYDEDPVVQEKNLGLLLDRIKKLKINTVYLQAFADSDGDGNADKLYFPNRHLPMRSDLFNRVAWQLRTRSGVEVYAWMPVFSFDIKNGNDLYIKSYPARSDKDKKGVHRRLSPFSVEARKIVGEIYEDLAKRAIFAGILFHDDAYLNANEDANELALNYYSREWQLPPSIEEIRGNPEYFNVWSKHKTNIIIEWTTYLMEKVRYYRPTAKSARNLYAEVVLNVESETWFAQSFEKFLENYDYTALMAMPYMEGAAAPEKWLKSLVDQVALVPGGLEKTVFELQSVDWREKKPIDSAILARQMKLLQDLGVHHYGYYPDNFIQSYPEIGTIKPEISISDYPYEAK